MHLNRIDLGTKCLVRKTGETGTLKKIFFFPTKFEIELQDGQIQYFSSKDLEFEGIIQPIATLKKSPVPDSGIGERWTQWSPFEGESVVKHHFSTTKEIMWDMVTSLSMYNVWFYGIQRALPISDESRYVHRFSFSHWNLEPGAYFKIRPKTIAPYFKCRIMTFEKEKEFGFTFKTSPLYSEYIQFSIEESESGVWVTCRRNSKGIFSFLSQYNWPAKSRVLQQLDTIVPKVEFGGTDESSTDTGTGSKFGGFASKQDYIDFAINMGMEGNMDYINSIPQKPIRGMAKAGVVKAKRTGVIPPKPEKSDERPNPPSNGGGLAALSQEELVAYLVNKGLDGDMDTVNAHQDKSTRGKAKAMIVKIKRGAIECPPMPKIPATSNPSTDDGETEEQLMERLITVGIEDNMDEINALDNKALRGRIKAAIVKAKRAEN